MAKGNRNGEAQAEATGAQGETVAAVASETAAPVTANLVAVFKRNHPQNRCSYGIPGVPGIIVVQRDLVAGTTPFTSNSDLAGMPPSITLGVELVQPKADNKQAKAEAAALKAKEKAEKAAAKVIEQQRKAEEKAAKAKAALEQAQAKAAAAQAAEAAKVETPA